MTASKLFWIYWADTCEPIAENQASDTYDGQGITFGLLEGLVGEKCRDTWPYLYPTDFPISAYLDGQTPLWVKTMSGRFIAIMRSPLQCPKPAGKPALRLPEDTDRITAALVTTSIPKFRNSDKCPRPLCNERGVFRQMALCCPVHGAFHP